MCRKQIEHHKMTVGKGALFNRCKALKSRQYSRDQQNGNGETKNQPTVVKQGFGHMSSRARASCWRGAGASSPPAPQHPSLPTDRASVEGRSRCEIVPESLAVDILPQYHYDQEYADGACGDGLYICNNHIRSPIALYSGCIFQPDPHRSQDWRTDFAKHDIYALSTTVASPNTVDGHRYMQSTGRTTQHESKDHR